MKKSVTHHDTEVACCTEQQALSAHTPHTSAVTQHFEYQVPPAQDRLEEELNTQRCLQALMQNPEALLNEQQLAQLTGLSLSRLRNDRYLRQGIPFLKLGSSVRYRVADVMSYLQNNVVDTRQQDY